MRSTLAVSRLVATRAAELPAPMDILPERAVDWRLLLTALAPPLRTFGTHSGRRPESGLLPAGSA